MSAITEKSFGILIAFLAPGFLALWGLRCFVPEVGEWFAVSSANPATVGGFLFVTVAAIAAGLLAQSVRHLTLDKFFARFLEGEHDGTGARASFEAIARSEFRALEPNGVTSGSPRHYDRATPCSTAGAVCSPSGASASRSPTKTSAAAGERLDPRAGAVTGHERRNASRSSPSRSGCLTCSRSSARGACR